jgi:hypothetical protein
MTETPRPPFYVIARLLDERLALAELDPEKPLEFLDARNATALAEGIVSTGIPEAIVADAADLLALDELLEHHDAEAIPFETTVNPAEARTFPYWLGRSIGGRLLLGHALANPN